MSMGEVLAMSVGILSIVAVVLTIVFAWVNRLGQQRTAALIAEYPQHVLVEPVNFFGRQSEGVTQMRGNGTLLLTHDSLVFQLWVPQKRLIIPLESITEMTFPRSFLGKTKGRRLLRVDFTAEGQPDAAAWFIRSPDDLAALIEQHRK